MQLKRHLASFAMVFVVMGPLFAETTTEHAPVDFRALLVGRWTAEMTLPNGIRLWNEENFNADGFASGRIITYFRDGSVKASTSYSFAWKVTRGILVSSGFVRVPPRPELPGFSRDQIVRLDASVMILKDLADDIAVTYKRR